MNIEKLEKTYVDYIQRPRQYQHYIGMFMQYTIDVLKDQSDMMADLQKQLAKKENTIDVKDIKEVKLLNREYEKYGKHDICALCRHYSDNGYCDIHSGYGKLVERDTCNDYKEKK